MLKQNNDKFHHSIFCHWAYFDPPEIFMMCLKIKCDILYSKGAFIFKDHFE